MVGSLLEIDRWHNLGHLGLVNAGIETVTPETKKLTKPKRLALNRNKMKDVPIGVLELPNLRCLDLSYNRIVGLPALPFEHLNLQCLNLANSKMARFPEGVKQLVGLEGLNHNRIQNAASWLGNLAGLPSQTYRRIYSSGYLVK